MQTVRLGRLLFSERYVSQIQTIEVRVGFLTWPEFFRKFWCKPKASWGIWLSPTWRWNSARASNTKHFVQMMVDFHYLHPTPQWCSGNFPSNVGGIHGTLTWVNSKQNIIAHLLGHDFNINQVLSRELMYPTFGKGKSSTLPGVEKLWKQSCNQDFLPNSNTPWKINMDHDYGGLEDHFPF